MNTSALLFLSAYIHLTYDPCLKFAANDDYGFGSPLDNHSGNTSADKSSPSAPKRFQPRTLMSSWPLHVHLWNLLTKCVLCRSWL